MQEQVIRNRLLMYDSCISNSGIKQLKNGITDQFNSYIGYFSINHQGCYPGTQMVYSRVNAILKLKQRKENVSGDKEHKQAVEEQKLEKKKL